MKIEKLSEIKYKKDARDPYLIVRIVEKINELINAVNKTKAGGSK
jgi:hypothetical protein